MPNPHITQTESQAQAYGATNHAAITRVLRVMDAQS